MRAGAALWRWAGCHPIEDGVSRSLEHCWFNIAGDKKMHRLEKRTLAAAEQYRGRLRGSIAAKCIFLTAVLEPP